VTEDLQTACPDAERLAEYVEGRLDGNARAHVEAHLAECEMCRDVVAETLLLQAEDDKEDTPGTVIPFPVKVIAAALAVAASLVLVLRVQPELNPFRGPTAYEELVAAVGTNRTVEARLTGGFRHGPLRQVTRSGSRPGSDRYTLLAAVARAQDDARGNPTPTNLHTLGLAHLLVDEYDQSITALEDASVRNEDARILSDLSAAYLQRGRMTGRAEDFAKAQAAAERAIRVDPNLVEPYFNRALSLDEQHQPDSAARAWQAYLARESSGPWADEARNHLTDREGR
jgi:tetratricopeptide (TPR) repeat protein